MAIFDTLTKTQAQTHPMDFVNHCLNFEQDEVTFMKRTPTKKHPIKNTPYQGV